VGGVQQAGAAERQGAGGGNAGEDEAHSACLFIVFFVAII
jgi:hypothetical protein